MIARFHFPAAAALALALAAAPALSQTITFQQGVDGYTGAFDRRISTNTNVDGASVDTNSASFFIDGDPNDSARSDYLIRFDDIVGGSGIPAGATILNATLNLRTTSSSVSSNSQSGESYNVYRLAQPFNSSSTLDGDFGDMNGAWTPFVDGVETLQGEADFNTGTFDEPVSGGGMAVDNVYGANVTRTVQSWVNGDPNYGLAVKSDHVDNDDGWSVHSTGSSTASFRPQLSVEYTTDPRVGVYEFQQGLGGYDGTSDILISSLAATIDGSSVSETFLDGSDGGSSPDAAYMVRFDVDSLPADSEVMQADLILKSGITSGASDSPGPYSVHQLLTPFDTTSAYSDFAGDVDAMELAGSIGPEIASLESIDEAELVSADVSAAVENWLAGDPNYGLYIGADGTSNGWQIFTSGAADSDLAPMLRIVAASDSAVAAVPEAASIAMWVLMGLATTFGAAWCGKRQRAERRP